MQSKFLLSVWFLLTLVFSALNLICFLYPFWFGSSYAFDAVAASNSTIGANQTNKFVDFGLYKICFTSTTVVVGEANKKKLTGERKKFIDYDEGQSIYEETSTVLTTTTNRTTTKSSSMPSSSSSSLLIKTKCFGNWKQHYSILNNYFKIATYLMLIACGFGVLSVVICSLMISIRPKQILYFDSAIQLSIGKLPFILFYIFLNAISIHFNCFIFQPSSYSSRVSSIRSAGPIRK